MDTVKNFVGTAAALLCQRSPSKGCLRSGRTRQALPLPECPWGPPGMGGKPQQYSVILFGPNGRRAYMQFVGSEALG